MLVLRGGATWVPQLKPYFGQVLQLDSGPYLKTVMRQRLVVEPDGKPRYRQNKTTTNAEVRALFLHNVQAKMSLYGRATASQGQVQASLQFDEVRLMREAALPEECTDQYLLDF